MSTEARVGEHTVPPECESCMSIEPGREAHCAMRGVLAVPLFQLKSAQLQTVDKSAAKSELTLINSPDIVAQNH